MLLVLNPLIAVVGVVLLWLLVVGAVRLMSRRSRWVLVLAGLPVTAFAGWRLVDVVLHGGQAWFLFLLMGPALAPLFALAPSVGHWLGERPAGQVGPDLALVDLG
ncbi:MAG: hypothetical protein ABWY29_06775 [Blastococcus sp.]